MTSGRTFYESKVFRSHETARARVLFVNVNHDTPNSKHVWWRRIDSQIVTFFPWQWLVVYQIWNPDGISVWCIENCNIFTLLRGKLHKIRIIGCLKSKSICLFRNTRLNSKIANHFSLDISVWYVLPMNELRLFSEWQNCIMANNWMRSVIRLTHQQQPPANANNSMRL